MLYENRGFATLMVCLYYKGMRLARMEGSLPLCATLPHLHKALFSPYEVHDHVNFEWSSYMREADAWAFSFSFLFFFTLLFSLFTCTSEFKHAPLFSRSRFIKNFQPSASVPRKTHVPVDWFKVFDCSKKYRRCIQAVMLCQFDARLYQ